MMRSLYWFAWAAFGLAFLVMVADGVISKWFSPGAQPAPAPAPADPGAAGQSSASGSNPPVHSHDRNDEIRSELRKVSKELRDASRNINRTLHQIDVWERKIEPLRGNAVGDAIRQNEELSRRMNYLLDADRPTSEELERNQDRIREFLDMVDSGADEPKPKAISAGDLREILDLQRQAADAEQVWTQAVEGAQAIVRLVANHGEEDKTLQDELDQQRLDRIDEQQKRDADESLEREARDRLRVEATSEEVKRVLAPFLAPRNKQPKRYGSSIRFDTVIDRQPMSLTRLQVVGALDDSVRGLEMLARVGTSHHLTEPRWHFHFEARSWNDDTLNLLKDAQQKLRAYGDILVEEGWLTN